MTEKEKQKALKLAENSEDDLNEEGVKRFY